MSRLSYYLVFVALLLVFFATRILHLEAFPIFIDEATHLHYGEIISQTSPLAYSQEGRQLTYWYYLFFQVVNANNPIWMARAVTLWLGMLGFAAFLASARLLAGRHAIYIAAAVYILSIYHFFFDRLAMADTLSSTVIIIAVYFSLRLMRRVNLWDALWLGITLFVAVLFKLSSLPFYGIPIAAALAISNARITVRQRVVWCVSSLAVAVGLLSVWATLLTLRGYNFLALFGVHNPSSQMSRIERWQINLGFAFTWLADYYTLGVILIVIGCLIYMVMRRAFYLPLVTLAPLFAILLNARQTPRYWMGSISIALLTLTVVLALVMRLYPRIMRPVLIIAAVIWMSVIWLPFVNSAYYHPIDLPLPEHEYNEYIVADASGFGLAEIVDTLRPLQPDAVIGLLSNCWGLQYTAPDLPIECPKVNPSGAAIPDLESLVESRMSAGTYVVREDGPHVPQTINGQVIAYIERPGQRANFTLYHLIP